MSFRSGKYLYVLFNVNRILVMTQQSLDYYLIGVLQYRIEVLALLSGILFTCVSPTYLSVGHTR